MAPPPDLIRARGPSRGFGLLELLTVVGLIAVLAAVAFPALEKARREGQRTACAGNLRQIGIGFAGYLAEHDNVFPLATDASIAHSETAVWGYALWTYVGYATRDFNSPDNDLQGNLGADRNIFHCPVTRNWPISQFRQIRMPNATAPVASRYSYAMNSMPSTIVYGNAQTPYRMSQILHPTKTALVLESDEQSGNWSAQSFFSYNGLVPHAGGTNVLFVDGHVELIAAAAIPPAAPASSPPYDSFWSGR